MTESKGKQSDSGDDEIVESAKPALAGRPATGFFTVYKKGQGYYTRLGTALGAGILIIVLGLFVYEQSAAFIGQQSRLISAGLTALIVAIGAAVAWRLMNAPRSVDFLISTDSEMKKVNWTSREELIGSTRIVILFLFVIAMLLFVIDVGTGLVFQLIGLLKFGLLS